LKRFPIQTSENWGTSGERNQKDKATRGQLGCGVFLFRKASLQVVCLTLGAYRVRQFSFWTLDNFCNYSACPHPNPSPKKLPCTHKLKMSICRGALPCALPGNCRSNPLCSDLGGLLTAPKTGFHGLCIRGSPIREGFAPRREEGALPLDESLSS